MLEAEEKPYDIEADCAAMKEAMEGWGTDETKLTLMICNKSRLDLKKRNGSQNVLFERF